MLAPPFGCVPDLGVLISSPLGALHSVLPRASWTFLKCCCLEQRKLFIWFYFIWPHSRAESVMWQRALWDVLLCCTIQPSETPVSSLPRLFPKNCRISISIRSARATLVLVVRSQFRVSENLRHWSHWRSSAPLFLCSHLYRQAGYEVAAGEDRRGCGLQILDTFFSAKVCFLPSMQRFVNACLQN